MEGFVRQLVSFVALIVIVAAVPALADQVSLPEFHSVLEKLSGWVAEGRIAARYRGEVADTTLKDRLDPSLPLAFFCVRDTNDREVIDELERHGAVQDPDVLDRPPVQHPAGAVAGEVTGEQADIESIGRWMVGGDAPAAMAQGTAA